MPDDSGIHRGFLTVPRLKKKKTAVCRRDFWSTRDLRFPAERFSTNKIFASDASRFHAPSFPFGNIIFYANERSISGQFANVDFSLLVIDLARHRAVFGPLVVKRRGT